MLGERPESKGRRRNGRRRWLILIGSAIFCVVVLFELVHAQPVEVTRSHLEQIGGQVYVAGQLQNRAETARAVKLELHYYDRSGHALGLDTLSFEKLPGGAVRNFRGPAHEAGTIAAYSIYLNEGRDPYGN